MNFALSLIFGKFQEPNIYDCHDSSSANFVVNTIDIDLTQKTSPIHY